MLMHSQMHQNDEQSSSPISLSLSHSLSLARARVLCTHVRMTETEECNYISLVEEFSSAF